MTTNEIKRGDKIKDICGEWHEVMEVHDNIVYTYTLSQKYIHITKIVKVTK